MTREILAMAGMCVCGTFCSALFDAFRGAHQALRRHDFIVILSDILYWGIVCAAVIYSLWKLNNGILRGYEFAGLAAGAALYFLTVSAYVYKFFLTISMFCVKIIRRICKILLTLRVFLYKIISAPFKGARDKRVRKKNGG